MKYLSVLVFALLLAWSWTLIHSEQRISFETHAGIQEKLAQLIQQTIISKKPAASNIRIEKIWTEPQSANDVLAHFTYSFQEPDTSGKLLTNRIQGQGLLEKQPDDGSGLDHWSLKKFKTDTDSVVFEDGLHVTPGDDEAQPTMTVLPADPNAAAPSENKE